MADQTFNGDMVVRGQLVATTIVLPTGSVSSASVQSAANLNADNLESRFCPKYSQPNTAATTETRTLFVARRPGTINTMVSGSIVAATGNSTVTLDVKKNGTSILTSITTLDNANTARVVESGVINGALSSFVAGDWFEVVITATIGTGTLPTGVFVQLEADQNGV